MQVRNLYLDYANPGADNVLLNGLQSVTLDRAPNWVSGDAFLLRLWFRARAGLGTVSTTAALDAASAIVVAGKANLAATSALFSATGFTQQTSGTDYYYEAVCDLNTADLIAALASASSLTAYVDVEVQNADNSRRITYRFSITVTKQVYAGTEGTTAGDPPYPAPANVAVNTPSGGLQKVIAGQWYIKNVTTGLWHPYWLEGDPPQLMFGAGVAS